MKRPDADSRPQWPSRLLKWFCPRQLLEEIEGDLLQRFERERITLGEGVARRKLFWRSLSFFRPGILLRHRIELASGSWQLAQNNVAMSIRNIRKDKLFSAINLFGLTVSMAAGLLIFQYAFFELHYDRGLSANTYRVFATTYNHGVPVNESALISSTAAPVVKSKVPEVLQYVRLYSTRYWFDCSMSYSSGGERKVFNERHLYYADPAALFMFSYRLKEGNPQTALSSPYSIVLSERTARKYFGNDEAIGKTLRVKGSFKTHDYVVTGVMTEPRADSHIDADIFVSISTLEASPGFKFSDAYTYVTLVPGVNMTTVRDKLHRLAEEVNPPTDERRTEWNVEPIEGIHLHSTLLDQMRPTGNLNVIYVLIGVALIVLLMAWINYVNLTISRAFTRAREVGIRKVSGATRRQVAVKFMTEVIVFNVFGVLSAALVAYSLAPLFYDFVKVPVPPDYLLTQHGSPLMYIALMVLVIGMVVCGMFPAIVLSGFNPITVLKGKFITHASRISLASVAVVFQFSCAIAFGIAVLVFNRQFEFVRQQDLGIAINKILVLRAPADVDSSYHLQLRAFKNDLMQRTIAHHTSTSSAVPGDNIAWTASLWQTPEHGPPTNDFQVNVIDPDFISAYDLKLLAGRNFTEADYPGEKFGEKVEMLIVNRRGLERLGFEKPEDAIGAKVYWDFECRIVGVVEDFYQQSLKQHVHPQVFIANNGPMVSIKLVNQPDQDFATTLQAIRSVWNVYFANNAFDYFFLDTAFDEQYAVDKQLTRVFNFFCALALVISCLGLFALSLFSTQLRTREICIRKVLGAPGLHLVQLLTREYLLLILIAAALAIPVAYWGIGVWLSGFTLRIDQDVWLYIVPVGIIVVAALSTVGVHTMKLVLKNSAEALKHE